MNYKYIDMSTYKRRKHFEYFNSMAFPYAGMTVNVDITEMLSVVKEKKLPFFLTTCYCISKAANGVKELRQRIKGNQIVEFEHCRTSHTEALEDETYCYCELDDNQGSFEEYIVYAKAEQEKARDKKSIEEDEEESLDKIYLSSVPWVSYTAAFNPVPIPADSHPRITWAKYFLQNDRVWLPVTMVCNHALLDGRHVAEFYRLLDNELEKLVKHLRKNME